MGQSGTLLKVWQHLACLVTANFLLHLAYRIIDCNENKNIYMYIVNATRLSIYFVYVNLHYIALLPLYFLKVLQSINRGPAGLFAS